jgi:integrase
MGIFKRPDSDTYWMSLQVDGKRIRMSTGVQDLRLAEEIFAAWQVEQARTRWLGTPPPERDHTVNELIAEYLATVTPRKSAASQYRDAKVLTRFDEKWGVLSLAELTTKMLDDYLAERTEAVTFATVSKELGLLKAAYARAIHWGWATTSPFRGIRLNQEGNERLRWLTEEEAARLLQACPPWLRDIVIVGLDTGLRRGNLVGLRWAWVQQHGTILMIPKQHVKGKVVSLTIPLTKQAAAVIGRQIRRLGCEWVFTDQRGMPYTPDQVSMAFYRAAKRAGLSDVGMHTLRHTFISRLVQAGRPLPEVAALAGHRDIRMTMRYAHLAPSHLHEGIQALERRLSPDRNQQGVSAG